MRCCMSVDEIRAMWREKNKKYYQEHKEEVRRKQKNRNEQKRKKNEYYKQYYQENKEMSCKHKYTFWLKKIIEISDQIKVLEAERDNALVQFENNVPVDVWNYIVGDIASTLKNYKKSGEEQ